MKRKCEDLCQIAQIMIKLKDIANKSNDYGFVVNESETRIIDLAGTVLYTTTCTICNYTCRENAKNMPTYGNCTVYPNECTWSVHKNLPYIYEMVIKQVKKTHEHLKQQHFDAMSKLSQLGKEFQKILNDLECLKIEMLS